MLSFGTPGSTMTRTLTSGRSGASTRAGGMLAAGCADSAIRLASEPLTRITVHTSLVRELMSDSFLSLLSMQGVPEIAFAQDTHVAEYGTDHGLHFPLPCKSLIQLFPRDEPPLQE